MSKKSKKRPKPLDQAARARIAARRERKGAARAARAAARQARDALRAREAMWFAPEAVAQREIVNAARLADEAVLAARDADGLAAGIIPQADGKWELIFRDAMMRWTEPMDSAMEAVLTLYVESSALPFRQCFMREGSDAEATTDEVAAPIRAVEVVPRNEVGEQLLEQTRATLYAKYRAGELEECEDTVFYDYFADEQEKLEMERRWEVDAEDA